MLDYEGKLNLLSVKELKSFINTYNLSTKIVMTKKKKEELIVEILKHTELQNNKVVLKNKEFDLELREENIKVPKVRKPREPKTEMTNKEKIIKGYYYYIIQRKNEEGDKLFRNDALFEHNVIENIKDITNDNILNWFNSKEEYNKFKNDNTKDSELSQYLKDLEQIQNQPKELKNKLKNLNIITVDVNDIHNYTGRKYTYSSTLYDIMFRKLDINKGFRKEEKIESKPIYDSDRDTFKILPSEKQIYSLLKKRNIKFYYFIYIFSSTYSATTDMPTKYTGGEGYDKSKEYLYNKKGELVKIIRDSETGANIYSILQYFTEPKKEVMKQEPKKEVMKQEPNKEVMKQEPEKDSSLSNKVKEVLMAFQKIKIDTYDIPANVYKLYKSLSTSEKESIVKIF